VAALTIATLQRLMRFSSGVDKTMALQQVEIRQLASSTTNIFNETISHTIKPCEQATTKMLMKLAGMNELIEMRSKHLKGAINNAYIYFIHLLLFMNIATTFKTHTMQT
jgi:hypothetical protein